MNKQNIPKGMAGVIAGSTAISTVDPDAPALYYRGYDVRELCRRGNFMETAWLIMYGELPSAEQLATFIEEEKSQRETLPAFEDILRDIPFESDAMDILSLGINICGIYDPNNHPSVPEKVERADKKFIRLLSMMPYLAANGYRISRGLEPVAPQRDLSYAANFLQMMCGREISATEEEALDRSLILYAEHGFNASTFTARVVASTQSDLYSSVRAAISSLKGPLHGGANEKALELITFAPSAQKSVEHLLDLLGNKKKVMGFGHRVYKGGDSRAPLMMEMAELLAQEHLAYEKLLHTAEAMKKVMFEQKGLHPNLDYPAALVYYYLGIPVDLFTPIFACARLSGWAAHIVEQLEENALIRPLSAYHGADKGRKYIPLEER